MTLTDADARGNLTPCAARIYAALLAAPGSKVIEVARAAGTANSTTANLLKQLEQDGLVRRTRGGKDGNRLLPDHWYPATPTPHSLEGAVSPDQARGSTNLEHPANTDGEAAAPSTATRGTEQPGEAATAADRDACTDELSQAARPDTTPGTTSPDETQTGRLGQGGLRALVCGFLVAHPDAAYSPTGIARHLGRSSGAVANALATLVNLGQAEMVTAKPRTYRLRNTPRKPS